MKKLNCWEFKKCGREPGGENALSFGVCPAARELGLHGVHEGANAGRACWVVAGTMCCGQINGTFAQIHENCIACAFFKRVIKEEGRDYQFPSILLDKLKKQHNFFSYLASKCRNVFHE